MYEVRAKKQSPMTFFITENMIGDDFSAINRCWDLKGSLHQRITNVSDVEKATGMTGLKVLKDQNFLDPNERATIDPGRKAHLMEIMARDSELLRKHGLIDYSIFLVEVDRHRKLRVNYEKGMASLVYDALQQQYVMKMIEGSAANREILKKYLKTSTDAAEKEASTGSPSPNQNPSITKSNLKFKKAVFNTVEGLQKQKQQSEAKEL